MLKKLIIPIMLGAFLGGGCFVSTRGHSHRKSERCPPGHAFDNGHCHPRGKHKGHKKNKKDVVIIRDHRR